MISILWVLIFSYWISISQKDFTEENETILITYKVSIKKNKNSNRKSTETVSLFISPKESIFIDRNLLQQRNLSTKDLPPQEKTREMSMIGLPWFKCIIVKNFEENSTIVMEEHLQKQYNAYQQASMSPENWNIISDSDSTIAGLKTHKAECHFGGRRWVAWFTPEIPVSDGPYKFSGLPGLIVKLESGEGDYSFHISGIERNLSEKSLPVIPNYSLISETRFKEIQEMMRNNPFAQTQSNGGTVVGDIKVNGKLMTQEEFFIYLKKEGERLNKIE